MVVFAQIRVETICVLTVFSLWRNIMPNPMTDVQMSHLEYYVHAVKEFVDTWHFPMEFYDWAYRSYTRPHFPLEEVNADLRRLADLVVDQATEKIKLYLEVGNVVINPHEWAVLMVGISTKSRIEMREAQKGIWAIGALQKEYLRRLKMECIVYWGEHGSQSGQLSFELENGHEEEKEPLLYPPAMEDYLDVDNRNAWAVKALDLTFLGWKVKLIATAIFKAEEVLRGNG
jgi:hypothetical protein